MLKVVQYWVKELLKWTKSKKYNTLKSNHKNRFKISLDDSDHFIFGISKNNSYFINQKLKNLLLQNAVPHQILLSDKSFIILSDQLYIKDKFLTTNSTDFFFLLPLKIDNQTPYILLDQHNNIISYNNLLNEALDYSVEKSTPLCEVLTKESIERFVDKKNSAPEIIFQKTPDNTFIISHSKNIGSLSCLYLFDITPYKNLEIHMAHSQKMQAIGQLASGISHDFNNLLTAIIGFCDLLLMKHPTGDPSFAEIMQIKQNSTRAANLVKQLLGISRKQALQPKITDISGTIAELTNLIRRLIGENIDLNIINGTNLKPVKIDKGQLEQIIINLAVNARDAIFKHNDYKGKIDISTEIVTLKNKADIHESFVGPDREEIVRGEYILISVKDNGIGIPTNIINKIFEPFFSTKAIGSGTGLGLSTVYNIIKQTNGMIYVASKENEGTTFNIYLKTAHREVVEEENNNELSVVPTDLTGSSTILLVEDEIPVRMFCTHALKNKGYKVIEATNGEEALEIFKKAPKIDLVISDVIMPGITGPTLVAEIQKHNPYVKVIFMSGYAKEAFTGSNKIKNDFNFLSKPFTLMQLAKIVKDVLNLEKVE